MGDDSEWMKLPPEQRVDHKVWKARVSGYEELCKLFDRLDDEKSPEFQKYAGFMKKFVTESNAIAQEKALDVVLLYTQKAPSSILGRIVQDVSNGIVTKCLSSARAKTKEKAYELIMLLIEAEKQEMVQEALMAGLANKNPKIVTGCVLCLRESLRCFGSKIIQVKPMVKQFQRLLEDRDKNIREEGKLLVVEIYRWIGTPIKPQLANLKPVQISELEAEFENLPPTRPQQERFLRSQQDLKEKLEQQAMEGGDEDGEAEGGAEGGQAEVEMDPYDLMDPVDILAKLPKEYYDKIEAKKWQERKEMLEALKRLTENPKLADGDYHDVVKTLKKVVAKDTNVLLVSLAIKIISDLANGLRKKFSPHAAGCIDCCLEKFREKKPAVVASLKEAVDGSYAATNLDHISESCAEYLGHKTPSVKAETAAFLARCFTKSTPTTLPKKLLKLFAPLFIKLTSDSVPDVREQAYQALGTAMKVVGEKHLLPYLADLDNIKMTKIKECCDKAELMTMSGKPRGGGGGAAAKPAAAAAAAPPSKAPAKAAPAKTVKPKAGAKPGGKAAAGKKKPPAKGKKDAGPKEEVTENILSDDVVEEKIANLLPADNVTGLVNSNWKERLAAMEKLTEVVKPMPTSDIPTQVCVRTICKKPGLKENNFQVMKLKVQLIAFLAKNSKFTTRSADFCLTDLVDKIGDVKNSNEVHEALSCIAESCGLEFVASQVIDYAFSQKNPKNQSESINWLAGAIRDFGFKLNVKPLLQHVKIAFKHTNPAVRNAAIALVGVMYMYMGQTLRVFFEEEKAALLQSIDAEIEKVKGQQPPAPTRGKIVADSAAGDDEEEEDDEEEGADGGVNVADLVPRTDISDKITDGIIEQMSDKNWKIRNEGIQQVITLLNEAKFITANIGPLPEALKVRLGDSNKILVGHVITICQTLATAMGPHVKNHVHVIGPGILSVLGDSKPQIRANAVSTLNQWVELTGLTLFLQNEIMCDALKIENPNLKTELLGWLATVLPNQKKLPVPELVQCIPFIFSSLEDRNAGVRAKAQEAILPFMIHTGYDPFGRQAGKLKPTSKDTVMKHLEKARADLPQKPVKTAKVVKPEASTGKARVVKPPVAQVPDDDDDVSPPPGRPATAPAKVAGGKGKGKATSKKPPITSKAAAKKAAEEEDTGPPMKNNNLKEQRFKDERNMKLFKWNFTTPRGEFVEQLQTQMEQGFSKTITTQLYHPSDFKMHIRALDALQADLANGVEPTIANCDLILKWTTLRFFDTNTSVLLKILEYLQVMFESLSENDYHLADQEAVSFIPYLVNKVGDPKDSIRKDIRHIFKQICQLYPSSKMFSYVLNGLTSKNTKQRTECLEELGSLIEIYGINVCQPSPAQALKQIASQIGVRDNSVRSAALNSLVSAYHILGETVYKYVGKLNDKDMGMLEERIKRSSKSRPQTAPAKASPEHENPKSKVPPPQKKGAQVRSDSIPRNAPPKPRKGAFHLDIDDNDSGEDSDLKLEEHNLDFLNEQVTLPEPRVRPPSPSMKLLSRNNDAKSMIDLVIAQIASNDITTSIQALAQIDEVLMNDEKAELLESHVDQILIACTLQLRTAYHKHMSTTDGPTVVIRLYKALVASLVSLFECKSLGKHATKDVLKDLVYNLLVILLDDRHNQLNDGPHIVRSVNIMVVKIVEKSDRSSIMCALIRLLHDSLGLDTTSHRYMELIMKCLWKMVRMIPSVISELDLDQVIGELHRFLKSYPSHTWKARSSDTPLRTVKTILHSLAKLKGPKIMAHMSLVDTPNSEVEAYLNKVLKGSSAVDANVASKNNQNEAMNGNSENIDLKTAKKEAAKTPSRKIGKTTHDMLAEIFKKIGSKENTREGLNDLYDFKQQYPEADLDPFLKKSSPFFQSYIERGLKTISNERDGKKLSAVQSEPAMSNSNSAASLSSIASAPGGESESDANFYRERLMVLRARCGLDNNQQAEPGTHEPMKSGLLSSVKAQDSGSNSSLSSNSSGGISLPNLGSSFARSAPESSADSNEVAASVVDLKKRLERIKNAMK